VAQILYRDGSDAPATEVITVADLLSRNAPAPVREVEPDTGGISVGALLRREGRAPRAADRPLQPRPRQEAAPAEGEHRTDRRVLVRRGAIAAGALVAAGSVLGAALLTDIEPTANQAPATGGADDDGPYAGQGLLDPDGPVAAPPDSVVIDQASARDPLDPGSPAPSDWVPVAFPGALPGGTDGGDPPSNGGSSSSSGDESSPVAAATGDDDDDDKAATSTGDSGSSASKSSSSRSGASNDSGRSSSDDSGDDRDSDDGDSSLLGKVGNTVGGLVNGLGLSGDDRDSGNNDSNNDSNDDGDEKDSKGSRSLSLLSADDGDEEDSSAPQDEDHSESSSDAKSSDSGGSEDSDSDQSSDDGGDSDDGDGGLVGGLLGTAGGLLS
jgi:hypothetical protein